MNAGYESRLPRDWAATLIELLRHETVVVRVVIAETRGSTPREAGAFMLVGQNSCVGTIGGGRLEWEAITAARTLLGNTNVEAQLRASVLGIELGQCCGGGVSTWLERFTRKDLELLRAAAAASARGPALLVSTLRHGHVERRLLRATDSELQESSLPTLVRDDSSDQLIFRERLDSQIPAVWLYGAGHVGQAVAKILMELPLCMTWIDSRPELRTTPGVRYEKNPAASVPEAPAGAYFLVMTHSHPLDFQLCREVLQRDDFAWLGLIGSQSKSARFRSHLRRSGLDANAVARMVCPIGIEGIRGKWPATIAVAVAAQIMRQISAASAPVRATLRQESWIRADLSRCEETGAKVTS